MQWTVTIFEYIEEYVESFPLFTNTARPALTKAIEQWLVCRDVATVQDMNESSGGQRIKV